MRPYRVVAIDERCDEDVGEGDEGDNAGPYGGKCLI